LRINPKPVAPTKLISKGDKIKDNLFALQLSAIPGVSFSTALVVGQHYPTMKELIFAFETAVEPEKILSTIQLNEKRKLGTALSLKIYNALH
jgi:hypothetical protein